MLRLAVALVTEELCERKQHQRSSVVFFFFVWCDQTRLLHAAPCHHYMWRCNEAHAFRSFSFLSFLISLTSLSARKKRGACKCTIKCCTARGFIFSLTPQEFKDIYYQCNITHCDDCEHQNVLLTYWRERPRQSDQIWNICNSYYLRAYCMFASALFFVQFCAACKQGKKQRGIWTALFSMCSFSCPGSLPTNIQQANVPWFL